MAAAKDAVVGRPVVEEWDGLAAAPQLLLIEASTAEAYVSLTLMNSILVPALPTLSIKLPWDIHAFEQQVSGAATTIRMLTSSEQNYVGPGTLILDVRSAGENSPKLRFIRSSATDSHVRVDVYKHWVSDGPHCDEYVTAVKEVCGPLLAAIRKASGRQLRLSIGARDPLWDWDRSDVDCRRLYYAKEKLGSAIDVLTLHPGDIRDRLYAAFIEIQVLRSEALPAPLRMHRDWILRELTMKEERVSGQGRVLSTLGTMRKQRAVEIAERIVALHRAVHELCPDAG